MWVCLNCATSSMAFPYHALGSSEPELLMTPQIATLLTPAVPLYICPSMFQKYSSLSLSQLTPINKPSQKASEINAQLFLMFPFIP